MKSRRNTFSISQYDKIVIENLETAIPALPERLLHIYPVESEELPDDRNVGPAQHTKERKPDALKRIRDRDGNLFILHLEFQVADDPDMVYRKTLSIRKENVWGLAWALKTAKSKALSKESLVKSVW